jgi:hypothetical protein
VTRLVGLLIAVLAFVAAGCGGSTAPPAATAPPDAATTSAVPVPVSNPTRIEVDKIGASSSLIPLGKEPSGEIQVPSVQTPQQAGWYSLGVVPGQLGPAVILGHVDGGGKPGIFKRLREMQAGDTARVLTEDGRTLTFRAYEVVQAEKANFPTARVYGDTEGPELRLITCGGVFVGGDLGYNDNIIVFMRLEQASPAGP